MPKYPFQKGDDMTFQALSSIRSQSIAQLVIAAQSGNRAAFGELFDRYRGQVLSLAMRYMNNVDEAEELLQDVFVQAMQKIHQLRVPEAFGGWIRQIVHRMAINRYARRSPVVPCDPDSLETTCHVDDLPEAVVVRREETEGVRDGLSRLSTLDRRTLEAFYLHGQTLIEMSVAFDAPVGTIKRRLHVARKRLAKEMDARQAV